MEFSDALVDYDIGDPSRDLTRERDNVRQLYLTVGDMQPHVRVHTIRAAWPCARTAGAKCTENHSDPAICVRTHHRHRARLPQRRISAAAKPHRCDKCVFPARTPAKSALVLPLPPRLPRAPQVREPNMMSQPNYCLENFRRATSLTDCLSSLFAFEPIKT